MPASCPGAQLESVFAAPVNPQRFVSSATRSRAFLDQVEPKVTWDEVWGAVAKEVGAIEIAKRQRERLQRKLGPLYREKLHQGRPPKKVRRQ